MWFAEIEDVGVVLPRLCKASIIWSPDRPRRQDCNIIIERTTPLPEVSLWLGTVGSVACCRLGNSLYGTGTDQHTDREAPAGSPPQ